MNRDIQASEREIAVENRQAVPHRDVPGMRARRERRSWRLDPESLCKILHPSQLERFCYTVQIPTTTNCVYEDANRQACKKASQGGRRW